jgi:hypothetical protein
MDLANQVLNSPEAMEAEEVVVDVVEREGEAAVATVAPWLQRLGTSLQGLPQQVSDAAAEGAGAVSKALVPYYPANNGFLGGSRTVALQVGQIIDRVGGSAVSRFFSPAGTPLAARALPVDLAGLSLRSFQVIQPFAAQAGIVAPAFGQLGLGIQFRTDLPLQELLDQGFLQEVSP